MAITARPRAKRPPVQPLNHGQKAVVLTLLTLGVGFVLVFTLLPNLHALFSPITYTPLSEQTIFDGPCSPHTWNQALLARVFWAMSTLGFGASLSVMIASLCHLKNALDNGWSKGPAFALAVIGMGAFLLPMFQGCG